MSYRRVWRRSPWQCFMSPRGVYAMRCTFLCQGLMLALFMIYLDSRPHRRASVLDHEIITDTPRGGK
jgi:hypothetical protein